MKRVLLTGVALTLAAALIGVIEVSRSPSPQQAYLEDMLEQDVTSILDIANTGDADQVCSAESDQVFSRAVIRATDLFKRFPDNSTHAVYLHVLNLKKQKDDLCQGAGPTEI